MTDIDELWRRYQVNWQPGMPIIGRPAGNQGDGLEIIQQLLLQSHRGFAPSRVCENCFVPIDTEETGRCVRCESKLRTTLRGLGSGDIPAAVPATVVAKDKGQQQSD